MPVETVGGRAPAAEEDPTAVPPPCGDVLGPSIRRVSSRAAEAKINRANKPAPTAASFVPDDHLGFEARPRGRVGLVPQIEQNLAEGKTLRPQRAQIGCASWVSNRLRRAPQTAQNSASDACWHAWQLPFPSLTDQPTALTSAASRLPHFTQYSASWGAVRPQIGQSTIAATSKTPYDSQRSTRSDRPRSDLTENAPNAVLEIEQVLWHARNQIRWGIPFQHFQNKALFLRCDIACSCDHHASVIRKGKNGTTTQPYDASSSRVRGMREN